MTELNVFAYRCELMNNYVMCLSGIFWQGYLSPNIGLLKGRISRAVSGYTKYIVSFLFTSQTILDAPLQGWAWVGPKRGLQAQDIT